MKKPVTPMLVLVALVVAAIVAIASSTTQTVPFTQNWSNAGLITTNNDWSGVPGINGYFGENAATNTTAVDPQTLTTDLGDGIPDVFANQTNASSFTSGGPAEFDALADPTVAMQGSGTADSPHLILYIDTLNKQTLNLSYNLRDIDCGATSGIVQQFCAQYRIGGAGSWTNIAGSYVANASDGLASTCTKVTPVSVALPAACNNVAEVQIRILTTNAISNDEEIGVDDISVTGVEIPPAPAVGPWGLVLLFGMLLLTGYWILQRRQRLSVGA
jgi:uncharacterized protein